MTMTDTDKYAHSLPGRPLAEWERLPDHLKAVAERAAVFAAVFGWAQTARSRSPRGSADRNKSYLRDPVDD